MPEKAYVTSLEALEAFRSNLIVYLSQARPALDEVSSEVMRVRLWLENDQRLYWENQMRRRTKDLEQAQQALFSARLGVLRKETSAEQFAVHRAKAAVMAAEDKLRIIKKWDRDFDGRMQPLVKQTEKLHTVFSNDLVQAIQYLAEAIKTLSAYSERHAPISESPAVAGPSSGSEGFSLNTPEKAAGSRSDSEKA